MLLLTVFISMMPALADDIRNYIREIAPEKEKIVKYIKVHFQYLTISVSINR